MVHVVHAFHSPCRYWALHASPHLQVLLSTGLPNAEKPARRRSWRAGKMAVDLAMSPCGRFLAVSHGDVVRLYDEITLTGVTALDSIRSAEV